jgi:predicted  nucleic acid-binding Zn-ribbon protein
MTDDWLQAQLRDLHAGPIAAEVLRLRSENETLRRAPDHLARTNYDSSMRALQHDLDKAGIGPNEHLPSRLSAALDELVRLRKEQKDPAAPAKSTQQVGAQAHQRPAWMTTAKLESMATQAKGYTLGDLACEVLHLDAELAERTRELARWQAAPPWRDALQKAEAERDAARGEVERLKANALGWDEDVKRADEKRDAAIRDRNEFAAQQLEGFVDWALTPGAPWSGELRDAARARAAQLRAAPVSPSEPFVFFKCTTKPATEPKPEPAAEPSIIPALRKVATVNCGGDTSRAVTLLCDAVEALAHEVRR